MEKDSGDKVFERLENVRDKQTFIIFVKALANERDEAEQLEKENPVRYQLGGALDWQNGDISSFLWAGLESFEEGTLRPAPSDEPSWKTFAEFLYFGKIYE